MNRLPARSDRDWVCAAALLLSGCGFPPLHDNCPGQFPCGGQAMPVFEPDPPPQFPQIHTWSPEPAPIMPPNYPAQFNGMPLDGSPQGRTGCPGIPLPGSNYCVVQ